MHLLLKIRHFRHFLIQAKIKIHVSSNISLWETANLSPTLWTEVVLSLVRII